MKTVGIFVGENGKWSFFKDIYDEIEAHYQTNIFEKKTFNTPLLSGRLNRWALYNGIRSTMQRSDVCFFEWASELLVYASHMSKYCPIVTRLHSYEVTFWASKINWDHVDKVILVSQSMRQRFSDLYPDHAHKTKVIYNGISLDKFRPPARRKFDFNIGMLCSIHPVKRIYEIIIMIYNLKKRGYQPHLYIGGGRWEGGYFDDYYYSIKSTIEKLGLDNDVTLSGHINNNISWLQNIDIFISNSYWEGQQVALLEAMATGCYCLSHFWDGVEEVLPPDNIYITEDELLMKIGEYYNLEDIERLRHQDQVRTIAGEKFDSERQKAEILAIIDEVGRT